MITVYFDRNVYAEICELRNDLTLDKIEIIKKAVQSKQISVPLSSALLAETIAVLNNSNEEFLKQIKTVFSFISKERMIKLTDDLLRDDCISFAYLAPFQRTVPLSDEGKKFINSPKISSSFLKIAHTHPQSIRKGVENINQAVSEFRENLRNAQLNISNNFIDLWKESSIRTVKKLISTLPDREKKLCERHGIEKC